MLNSSRLTALGVSKEIGKRRKNASASEKWISDDEGTRGGGRLVIRLSPTGTALFYFRYSIDGVRFQLPIGPFTFEPSPGMFTLDQARQEFRKFSAMHRAPDTRDVIEAIKPAEQAKLKVQTQAEELERQEVEHAEAMAKYSLKALCECYVKHLKTNKKVSARLVETQLILHVFGTDIALLAAKVVTPKQIAAISRPLVEQQKGRTASRLRSYLHAAYELAIGSENDASVPSDFAPFDLEFNPVARTKALSKFNTARERSLDAEELRKLWRFLSGFGEGAPLSIRAIRLVMLLGGQRGEQTLRINWATDVDLLNESITIFDNKGKRTQARLHRLPLFGEAAEEVRALIHRSKGLGSTLLFQGSSEHLSQNELSKVIKDFSRIHVAEKVGNQPFQYSDIRRTIETNLAALGISKDVRAQIQSHGLGGVQDSHYDKHNYYEQKKEALELWGKYLDSLLLEQVEISNIRKFKRF